MPSLKCDGLDALVSAMEKDARRTEKKFDEMLLAGAEQVRDGWRKAAREKDHIDTGEMFDSIDYNNKPKKAGDVKYVEIYPMGKRKGGKRNAEVAYVLHYGTQGTTGWRAKLRLSHKKHKNTPGIPGSFWVDRAEEISAPASLEAMWKIWNKE